MCVNLLPLLSKFFQKKFHSEITEAGDSIQGNQIHSKLSQIQEPPKLGVPSGQNVPNELE